MPSEPPMKSKSCTPITTGVVSSRPEAKLDRIVHTGLGAGIFQAIDIFALIAKFQRIN